MRLLLAALLVLNLIIAAPPAQAAGLDDYPAAWQHARPDWLGDTWNYYNRECTSFVAWRVSGTNGMTNFPHALGNAGRWGRTMASITDQTPARGAVAWWSENASGASRFGHVAWIRSVGRGTITVEEYNGANPYAYGVRTINTTAKGHPTGYIHFNDLVSVAAAPAPPPPPPPVAIAQIASKQLANLPMTIDLGAAKSSDRLLTGDWDGNGSASAGFYNGATQSF